MAKTKKRKPVGLEQLGRKQAVELMNEKVCLIRRPPAIYDMAQKQLLKVGDFKLLYANQLYWIDGAPKSATDAWLKSSERLEYDQLVYDPSRKCPKTDFNMYPGWGAAKSEKGDIDLYLKLMDSMYGSNNPVRTYVDQWNAFPIQHPGSKLAVARLLLSVEGGVGKGAEGAALTAVYGKKNVRDDINENHLESQFTDWLENVQLIIVPETWVGADSKWNLANKMKDFITNPTVPINRKNVPAYTLDSCTNYLFHSNKPDAMKIDNGDRRFHVHEIYGEGLKHNAQFWKDYFGWLQTPKAASALRYYFEHVDLNGFQPKAPAPVTSARHDMVENTSQPIDNWARGLKSDPDAVLCGSYHMATTEELIQAAKVKLDERSKQFLNSTRMGVALRSAGLMKIKPTDLAGGKDGRSQVKLNGQNVTLWALKILTPLSGKQIRLLYKPVDVSKIIKDERKF